MPCFNICGVSTRLFAENHVADYGRADANKSYTWVAFYTLKFLDAYLKGNAAARVLLEKTPDENGVPKHFMDVTFRPAQKHTITGK
ncbi:MAG TPA: hypothetical protein VFA90_15150 [Terriglobales bacterium]|nr:hypothetical protein [Terriglobales bacterium]